MLDLRRLRVLRAVVRTGSVRVAAEQLGYTSSAISQQIAALERETGTVLLEKAGRGVRPTDAARLLADVADDVLDRLADAEAAVASMRAGRTGRLHLTFFPSAGAALVPPAVARLRREHPEVELVLGVAEPDEALPALRAGVIDLAVVVEPFGPGELVAQAGRTTCTACTCLTTPTPSCCPLPTGWPARWTWTSLTWPPSPGWTPLRRRGIAPWRP